MENTLYIIVAIVVILVVALVVLTIFGNSAGQIGSIVEFKQNCIIQASATCASSGSLPLNWNTQTKIAGQTGTTSCGYEYTQAQCKNRVFISGDTRPPNPSG